MKEDRRKKGQEIAKKIIAEYFVQNLPESDIDYGIITVTDTKLSSDLSYIDVYVSSLKNGESLTKFLAEHGRDMQRVLCKALPIAKIPRIRFRYDNEGKDSFEIYTQIQDL